MSDKEQQPETPGDDPQLAEQWGDGRTPAETGQVGHPDFDPRVYQPYGSDDQPPKEAGTAPDEPDTTTTSTTTAAPKPQASAKIDEKV